MPKVAPPPPSFVPSGFLSLHDAIERFGNFAFGAEFQKIEEKTKSTSVATNRTTENRDGLSEISEFLQNFGRVTEALKERTALRRKIEAKFRSDLFDGKIRGHIRSINGRIFEIPKSVWGFDHAGNYISSGRVSWISGTENAKTTFEGECLVGETEFEKYLRKLRDHLKRPPAEKSDVKSKSAKYVSTAMRIMARLAAAGGTVSKKEAAKQIEQETGIETRPGMRVFERAWKAHALDAWKRAGVRPSKSTHN